MEFTLNEKKYMVLAIDTLTKTQGIANAAIGISIIQKLQPIEQPEQPEGAEDDTTSNG